MRLSSVTKLCAAVLMAASVHAGESTAKVFPAGTKSPEAAASIREIQARAENLQFGPKIKELAQAAIAADPQFALAYFYLAGARFPPDMVALDKAVELAKTAPPSHRRYIEIQATTFRDPSTAPNIAAIEPLQKLAEEFPDERFLQVFIGQYQQMDGRNGDARKSFERALALDASTPRVHALLAGLLILDGDYGKARAALEAALAMVPADAAPANIRYQVAFTHLYEGHVDEALATLTSFVDEYAKAGRPFGLPEVFIWNSIARINLENGRLEQAMKAYERGYQSVPGSNLDETQKQLWRGRLLHGQSRTLARMGKHEEAWKNALAIRKMIDEGGEEAKQFEPAYHYVAGYCKLEAGESEVAIEHLLQSDPTDPFHRLLLARAYEKVGKKVEARKTYQEVVDSKVNNIERALAYPEARRKLGASS